VSEITGVTRCNFGSRDDYADPEGFGSSDSIDGDTFDVDDSVSAFVRCETGQTISLEVAWATNRPPAKELVVRGTEAGARLNFEGAGFTLYEASDLGVDHYVTSEITTEKVTDGHVAEMRCFLDSVGGSAPSMNTIAEGLAVQRVIDAIYRSSEGRRGYQLEPTRAKQLT
jgi:predicted dehydrogenase